MYISRLPITLLLLLYSYQSSSLPASLTLSEHAASAYTILIPRNATSLERKSASVLQTYFMRVTSVRLDIREESDVPIHPVISIGSTAISVKVPVNEGFDIRTAGQDIVISGGGKGLLFGVYSFIEKYLGCRKWSAGEPAVCPIRETLRVPANMAVSEGPAFAYRELYYPVKSDQEYMDWHKLHQLEDLWGIWGHSFNKLADPGIYFSDHPEYFAWYNGRRTPSQLCLSNKAVFDIVIASLEEAFANNPDATYWSVSPNDEAVHCECDRCQKADAIDGGPQGSLVQFVNKIARRFPDRIFTTLAYTYSAEAPLVTVPEKNVFIFLSSIDVYRRLSLDQEQSAVGFRNNLKHWRQKTSNIFVWDYYTQFTNYLTPFPNTETLIPNMRFLKENDVKGVFAQGSGYTYSDMAELKAYILAKALWNPNVDETELIRDFLRGYYGKSADCVERYLHELRHEADVTKVKLDIYGNPINDHSGYLSPECLERYSQIIDECEAIAEEEGPQFLERIQRIRLTQEYVVLQQSKFYGLDKHGIFYVDDKGKWLVKEGLERRVAHFIKMCEAANVKELAENNMSLDQYREEWQAIFDNDVRQTNAYGSKVRFIYPFLEDFPAKRAHTLTDGTRGYDDYSYNWLMFYGTPMECILDLGEEQYMHTIEMNFLEDQRHWIFPPQWVSVALSSDGITFHSIGRLQTKELEENYKIAVIPYVFRPGAITRYIKVTAQNMSTLPEWRFHKNKKPMIACDEIWVY